MGEKFRHCFLSLLLNYTKSSLDYKSSKVRNIWICRGTVHRLDLKCFSAMNNSSLREPVLIAPPDVVRGMKDLDRELFRKTVTIPYVELDIKHVTPIKNLLNDYMLKNVPNLKPVQASDQKVDKLQLLLNPEKVSNFADLKDTLKKELIETAGVAELFSKDVTLTYDNWSADDVLKAVLPVDERGASGFSVIGHILHLNLREHMNDYKKLVGQVFLDKFKRITCVVNKSKTIDNTYRNFDMELLAGEKNTVVKVKENGFIYEFDFAHVYWNPRLCTEHMRVVNKLKRGDLVFDVFAGVGPFSIPAAKRGSVVFANDLNPESHKWLCHNSKINKVRGFSAFNLDGRCFIKDVVRKELIKHYSGGDQCEVHIVMNLPALAVEFLDMFVSLLPGSEVNSEGILTPWIHCYCFVKEEDIKGSAQKMVEDALHISLDNVDKEIFFVRDVSTGKAMMRVTFRMPKNVLFSLNMSESSPPQKIRKVESMLKTCD